MRLMNIEISKKSVFKAWFSDVQGGYKIENIVSIVEIEFLLNFDISTSN